MPRLDINSRIQELQVDTSGFNPEAYRQARLTEPELVDQVEESPGLFGRIKERFQERTEAGGEAGFKAIQGEQGLGSATLQIMGEGAGFVGDIGFEALKSLTPDVVERKVAEVTGDVAQAAAETSTAQSLVKWAEENPEAAANLEASINLASLIPGIAAVSKGGQAAVTGSKAAIQTAKTGAAKAGAARAVKASQKAVDKALDITKPVLTKKEREAAIRAGNVEKVKGVIQPKSTSRDLERAQAVAPFVDETNFIKSRDNIAQEIQRISKEEVRPLLKQKVGAFNNAQIKKQLQDVEIPTAFKADKTLENNYELVRKRMLDVVDDHPNTLEGLYDARIKFDQILVDEFGEAAFDSQAAIKRAARDVRAKVNEYINLQAGDDVVKDALRRQSLMYESIENIAQQNQKLFESTAWQRWAKANPKKAAAIRMGGTAVAGAGAYELVTP